MSTGRSRAGTARTATPRTSRVSWDRLGVERAALVGSSYGGKVALEVAATRPEAVTALVLLRSGMPGHAPGAALRSFDGREEALPWAGHLPGPERPGAVAGVPARFLHETVPPAGH